MKRLPLLLSVFCITAGANAQTVLTLRQCIETGIERNLSLQGKRNEMQKAKYGISENRARLLPQINGFASWNDNFEPPVSVTDGSAYGNPYNVTHTLRINSAAGLQMQMPLYNQTLIATMKVAGMGDELSRMGYAKAREDLIMQIAQMYYLGQNTAEQIALVKDNISRLEELRNITKAFYDNGMALEVDLKRVNINLENLQVQYDNAKAMLEQQLNLMKYVLDRPADEQIALTPVNTDRVDDAELSGLHSGLYELQMLEKQEQLTALQKKMVGYGYLPSLYLKGSLMWSAFTDKPKNLLHSGPSNRWFNSYGIGLQLNVPIFDGLDKKYKRRKADVDLQNIRLTRENTEKQLQTKYINATNDLMNNRRSFRKQKDNYRLAEDVYAVTMSRYKEGVASMTELLQDEMRMSEAQNMYVSAHYSYRMANLTLLKLTGRLDKLTD